MKYRLLVKPKLFKPLGIIYNSSQVIYPYILIPESLDNKLKNDDPLGISILEHEVFHLDRMKVLGVFRWYLRYVLNPKFRLNEEVLAYRRQFEVMKKYNIPIDIDRYSQILSSWTYLRMIDEKKANELLR